MIPYNFGLPYNLMAVNPPMPAIFLVSISSTSFFIIFVFLGQIPEREFSQVFSKQEYEFGASVVNCGQKLRVG